MTRYIVYAPNHFYGHANGAEGRHHDSGEARGGSGCRAGALIHPAARFIEGASAPVRVVPETAEIAPGAKRTSAMIRFDAALLARVDQAAKRRGVSRSAWVAFTLSKALD